MKDKRPIKDVWNAKNVAIFEGYVSDGRLTDRLSVIAKRIGCSIATVHTRIQRLKIKTAGKKKLWTEERLARVKALKDRNGRLTVSKKEAAAIIGCGEHLLRRQNRPKGLKPKTDFNLIWNQQTLRQLARLTGPDNKLLCSNPEAARVIGCHPNSLALQMRKLGIKPKYTPNKHFWTPKTIARLRAMVTRDNRLGYSIRTAARMLGCNEMTLGPKMRELGITPLHAKKSRR
jgi:transposase